MRFSPNLTARLWLSVCLVSVCLRDLHGSSFSGGVTQPARPAARLLVLHTAGFMLLHGSSSAESFEIDMEILGALDKVIENIGNIENIENIEDEGTHEAEPPPPTTAPPPTVPAPPERKRRPGKREGSRVRPDEDDEPAAVEEQDVRPFVAVCILVVFAAANMTLRLFAAAQMTFRVCMVSSLAWQLSRLLAGHHWTLQLLTLVSFHIIGEGELKVMWTGTENFRTTVMSIRSFLFRGIFITTKLVALCWLVAGLAGEVGIQVPTPGATAVGFYDWTRALQGVLGAPVGLVVQLCVLVVVSLVVFAFVNAIYFPTFSLIRMDDAMVASMNRGVALDDPRRILVTACPLFDPNHALTNRNTGRFFRARGS